MAKLYKIIRIIIETKQKGDTPANFILRSPTNEELNNFEIERYSLNSKDREKIIACRAAFFDKLLTGIEDFVDTEDQPIGVDRKDLIPDSWKDFAIFSKFEMTTIDIKNS